MKKVKDIFNSLKLKSINFIKNLNLHGQLLCITGISILIACFFTIVLLPNLLTPFYENNIYEQLKQPIGFVNPDNKNETYGEIAYAVISNKISISKNFFKVVDVNNYQKFLSKLTKERGKVTYGKNTFYYYTQNSNNKITITITTNNYIVEQRQNLSKVMFPIIFLTLLIVGTLLVLYSSFLAKKITILKDKIDHIDDDDYNHDLKFDIKDEMYDLEKSIENTRIRLKQQEEYKNGLFQSVSHELKTPISVIKGYIEASEDEVVTKEDAIKVIDKEINYLQKQVESLLHLNKIDYLKQKKSFKNTPINLKDIIKNSIDKYKVQNQNIKWTFHYNNDSLEFNGTYEMWQVIIDNILGNFLRYAKEKISIKVENNKIELYNDGPKIEKDILDSIFEPYKKGKNGELGLGLSIVKKYLELFGYAIEVSNEKKGVKFTIK